MLREQGDKLCHPTRFSEHVIYLPEMDFQRAAFLGVIFFFVQSPTFAFPTKGLILTGEPCARKVVEAPAFTLDSALLVDEGLKSVESGLLILDSGGNGSPDLADPSELKIAELYRRRLKLTGETLLLIPKYQGYCVPGFDGIVFDKEKRAIANVTFKVPAYRNLKSNVTEACNQVKAASISDSPWLSVLGRGSEEIWIPKVQQMFGVRIGISARQTRVVVSVFERHISETHERVVAHFKDRIKESHLLIESITWLDTDGFLEVKSNGVLRGSFGQ